MVRRLSLRLCSRYHETNLYIIKFHEYTIKVYIDINKIMIDIIKVTWLLLCFHNLNN